MLHLARLYQPAIRCLSYTRRRDWQRCFSTIEEERSHDPLKILFCGADDFSIHSLRALQALHKRLPHKVESITVLCKTDKAVDRGLRKSRAVPIKAVATELGLELYQIDSFRPFDQRWLPFGPYNLVVAVSFGLLVPSGVLEKAKYGGLNVHPSLLPDLRGSAPITHALLKRRQTTGVSLQTMHPTKFDHGVVLAQTKEVHILPDSTMESLLQTLGPLGAELLRKGIEDAAFVPPLRDSRDGRADPPHIELAPKISPKHRHIDWNNWTADEILLRDRVLGDLWDEQTFARCQGMESLDAPSKRVTYHGPWAIMDIVRKGGAAGEPRLVLGPFRQGLTLGIQTADGCVTVPKSATIEGRKKGMGLQALSEQIRMRARRGREQLPKYDQQE